MARIPRDTLLEKFRAMIARGEPIVGGGAGTGLSAKCEEAGGIDLIVIYNSGRYRMAGRGSLAGLLAYGNANEIVVDMAREVLPMVKRTPVLAGVNGTDPFMLRTHFLRHGFDPWPGLFIKKGQRQLCPRRAKGPGATGGDAGLIRHANHEAAFAFQINHVAASSLTASWAMMLSSSVGMTRSCTRLAAVLILRDPASLASGSSSAPSQASRAATRARIPG